MNEDALTQEHRTMLNDSGITDNVIESIGYRSLVDTADLDGLRDCPLPALYVPLHRPGGEPGGYQLRPDFPEPGADGRVLKYLSPYGQPVTVDCPPIMAENLANVAVPLMITEGSKKAAAAASHGYTCVSLSGVSCWRRERGHVLTDWRDIPLKDRTVAICYDSDVMTKSEVKREARALAEYLRHSRDAKVSFIVLPTEYGEKVGLDDWLAANPTGDPFRYAVEELADDLESMLPKVYNRTHQGSAERIADEFGSTIAWCPQTGWRAWDGSVWVTDAEHIVRRLILRLRDLIAEEIETLAKNGCSDEELGKHRKLFIDCQSDHHQRAVIRLLEPLVTVSWQRFDRDPAKLTVGNGTLVFGTDGTVELKEFDPDDRITRMTSTPYDPSAQAPFFTETMLKAQPDDSQRTFVQRAAGYSLLGGQGEQVLFINYGTGANLKSTFLSGIRHALGEWYAEIDPATLKTSRQSGSAPSPDKMRLMGPRVVTATETNDAGGSVDTEFLKRVAGGEEIVARQLHGKTIAFRPDFTLWLSMNHLPTIQDSSEGMWRRVHVIDWPYFVPPSERVDMITVEQRLEAEAAGILRWLVDGYRAYRFLGLNPPETVTRRTQKMRDDLDWFAQYQQDRLIPTEGDSVLRSKVWSDFQEWRRGDVELRNVKKNEFLAKMAEHYGEPVSLRPTGGRGWRGIALPGFGE